MENERMAIIQQPYCFGVSIVDGCNKSCSFCGIKAKKDRTIKFMDINLVKQIAESIGKWNSKKRISLSMFGEPTLHPKLHEIISIFRDKCNECHIDLITNNTILLKQYRNNTNNPVKALFDAGINVLVVDIYDNNNQKKVINMCNSSGIKVTYYHDKNHANPFQHNGKNFKAISIMGDISKQHVYTPSRILHNYAGNSSMGLKINKPLEKKCVRPYREMAIQYNGAISLCCHDWRREAILGVFPDNGSLQQIWESKGFQYARYLLYNKNRNIIPCYRCDFHGGFRIGLLKNPDLKLNKQLVLARLADIINKYSHLRHKQGSGDLIYKQYKSGMGFIIKKDKE